MLWTRTTSRGFKPRYQYEANPPPEREKIEHSEGWPHIGKKGNCLCLCKRCFGSGGCICSSCKHIGHDEPILLTAGRKADKVLT